MSGLLHTDLETIARYLRGALSHDRDAALAQVPAGMRVAAVLAPLYAYKGRPHLLFTRRSTKLNAHRGEISFPGGSYEPADGSMERTALREAQEEIGLDPARVEVLGMLQPVVTVVSNFTIIPFVGYLRAGPGPLDANPHEVDSIIEAPLAALADPTIFHSEEWVRAGEAHTVYFFDYGPHRIWGATGRMLVDLLERLRTAEEPSGAA
ncbi:MAG TPA: CoA pyrophosphatase [Ktedonobacterales bacterium]|nr:CoA pyrophosphatase [Ktedonobacterales bacterium]